MPVRGPVLRLSEKVERDERFDAAAHGGIADGLPGDNDVNLAGLQGVGGGAGLLAGTPVSWLLRRRQEGEGFRGKDGVGETASAGDGQLVAPGVGGSALGCGKTRKSAATAMASWVARVLCAARDC